MPAASAAVASPAPQILAPYHGPPPARSRVYFGFGLLVFWALLYGLFYAFFAPYFILMFAVPLAVLAALSIWALPSNIASTLDRPLEFLFYAFLCVLIVWPNYLAVAIPGLPWITLLRLVALPLVFVFLICISTSEAVRTTIAQVYRSSRVALTLYVAFAIILTLSIVLSPDVGGSIDKIITAHTTWTAILFASIFVFSRRGRIELWAAFLWGATAIVAVLAVWEYRLGHVVWAGHVPSFLKVDNPDVARIMLGQTRAGSGVYRVQSTLSTSVGLGEYLALSLPFVVYFAVENYPRIVRFLAAAMLPLLFVAVSVSGSRSGMIGLCITFLAYVFAWGAIRWRRVKNGLLGPAIVLAYPVFFAAFMVATLFVYRLRVMVWGGAETGPSTDARRTQYQMGIPKILHHPWGYGIGRGASVLNFHEPSGFLSIDTYYLSIALEYGVIGFILYYGTFLVVIGQSAKHMLTPFERHDREAGFLLPAMICLVNFVVIKSVFSQQDNHPLVFMVLGMAVAIIYRVKTYHPHPSTNGARLQESGSVVSLERPRELAPTF